jgi:hypothetical protein
MLMRRLNENKSVAMNTIGNLNSNSLLREAANKTQVENAANTI